MDIIFDSMGVQVQVQNETGNRLNTWIASLQNAGHTVNFTDYTQPIAGQLEGNSVLITTTHQWYQFPDLPPAIPTGTNFGYASADLGGIQTWVANGGGLLLFVNHSEPFGTGPYWPINDIQLAAALGITTVFASFDLSSSQMAPNPDAPAGIINGVSTIESVDSGGIAPVRPDGLGGTVLIPLPAPASRTGADWNTTPLLSPLP